MTQVGVVGLGDMGSGLAKNLMQHGFTVKGFDLDPVRLSNFKDAGGTVATSAANAGTDSIAVFIMVMNGAQAKEVIFGQNYDQNYDQKYDQNSGEGLVSTLEKGSAVIMTATIHAREVREIHERMEGSGIHLVDSPVSGGFPGAQSGTLTMMAAASDEALAVAKPVMEAVSATIHRVGSDPGIGQTVKACLQSVIGSIFSSVFEASTLAAKSGVSGEAFFNVLSTSGAGCGVANTALENIIDRKFEGTGSHISTMYKDLTISLDMAREAGVPLFTASTAMQLFQAGITKHPEGDNWVVTRVIEDIVGASLTR